MKQKKKTIKINVLCIVLLLSSIGLFILLFIMTETSIGTIPIFVVVVGGLREICPDPGELNL